MLLKVTFHAVVANDGSAVVIAVPEDFHEIAWDGLTPHWVIAPLVVAHVSLVGVFFAGFGLCAPESSEAETRLEFVNGYRHSRTVAVHPAPETLTIALVVTFGVHVVDNAHKWFHRQPCLTTYFLVFVPHEQGFD